MDSIIHYKALGNKSKPCLMIVHGLFGTLDNWQSLARKWAENFYVISVDVRNHGRSFHSDTMRIEDCALDLWKVLKKEEIVHCHLLGHSMGGKIAMEFAAQYPENLNSLIVVDVAPYPYPPHHADVFEMLQNIRLNQYLDRDQIEEAIRHYLEGEGVVQFMMKNIRRNAVTNQFEWKFNSKVLERNYLEIIQFTPQRGFNGHVLFVGGENSQYITQETSINIFDMYPKAELEFVKNAGHWVHADNPTDFYTLVSAFLSKVNTI